MTQISPYSLKLPIASLARSNLMVGPHSKKSVAIIVELPCCVMALILLLVSKDVLFLGSPHLPMLIGGIELAIYDLAILFILGWHVWT